MIHNCLAKKFVSLLRPIAFERVTVGHFIDPFVHRLDHRIRQRFGHVTDTATNDTGGHIGVLLGVNSDPTSDFRKQVTGFELEEVGIDRGHVCGSLTAPETTRKSGGVWKSRKSYLL